MRPQGRPQPTLLYRFSLIAGGIGLIATFFFLNPLEKQQVNTGIFSNVAIIEKALAVPGKKQGGFAWGDLNNDGLLDVVVNTQENKSSGRTRVLIAQGDPNNPTYQDKTSTYCKACKDREVSRSALMADINNDGYTDFIRNTHDRLEVYLNRGPADAYVLGIGNGNDPNFTLLTSSASNPSGSDIPGGMNTEGLFLMDYNNDGWLDMVLENHNWGIDIYANPADGSANFTFVDPVSIGLPTTATDGDYGVCADLDDDGDVDIVARKDGGIDIYLNQGGTFTPGQDLADTQNGNKGGVVVADFDNDGDMDLYWTDAGTNQIWINTGNGQFAPSNGGAGTGEPWNSAGMAAATNTDGCAAADINNDGKVDLFVSAASGDSYLFINQTPNGGSLSFVRNNLGISVNGDAEGASFVDYDNDGDMDLYINVHNGDNQLWRNGTNDQNFLKVEVLKTLGTAPKSGAAQKATAGTTYRSAVGATVVLTDCNGQVVSGIRDVPTASGHGTDAPDIVHFGLPNGPNATYNVVVRYVTENGTRTEITQSVVPSQLSGQSITITDSDLSNLNNCALLPIELLSFEAHWQDQTALLEWQTLSEKRASHFVVERSLDGQVFEVLGQVKAAGNTFGRRAYSFSDGQAASMKDHRIYYRLVLVDMDGQSTYSPIVELGVQINTDLAASLYPNPTSELLT
ncbi:MAG: VCBS repeat-containing protein, partial [Bacteroidetes bacterium]